MRVAATVVGVLLGSCGGEPRATPDGSPGRDAASDGGSVPDGRTDASAGLPDALPADASTGDAYHGDAAPRFLYSCALAGGPIDIFPPCGGYCLPELIAAGDRWVAGYHASLRVLALDGTPLADAVNLLEGQGTSGYPEVAFAGDSEGVWVSWNQLVPTAGSAAEVRLARIGFDGVRGPSRRIGALFSHPGALARSESGFAVAWLQGYASGAEGVFVEADDASGTPVGSRSEHRTGLAFVPGKMDLAISGKGYIGCYPVDGIVWYQIAFDGGGARRDLLSFETHGTNGQLRCSIARTDTATVAAWSSDSESVLVQVAGNEPPTVAAATPIRIDADGPSAQAATVTWNGAMLGVAYRYDDLGQGRVGFSIYSPTGEALSAPVTIASVGRYRTRPVLAAASDGTFGVGWVSAAGYQFARVSCARIDE